MKKEKTEKADTDTEGFVIIEHPADTGISLTAESLEKAFEIAAEGMFSIICSIKKVKPQKQIRMRISSSPEMGVEGLLVAWLEKLIYLHEIKKMLFSKFDVAIKENKSKKIKLSANVYGEKIKPSFHELYLAVKAPTYHKLSLKKDFANKGRWTGMVIFDV
ncbi:MAG: hypothetical protein BWY60_00884 [Actinobacteria bacterium ADurb.Bin346]|nr:MAG: hypothetical protein BWY60_00884 [Actinobacteria bacterium ADurb.Bin346]